MATRSKKKSQKANRRAKKLQQKRQRQKLLQNSSPAKRIADRLSKQEPTAWADELAEDVALFDDHTFHQLSAESQEHAQLVREALERVCNQSGVEGLEPLSVISRRSPFSEWRIFLRGMVDWGNRDLAAAKKAWSRLDEKRRPARIATALILSHSDKLSSKAETLQEVLKKESLSHFDQDTIYHAKLVRRSYVDREAIRTAREITQIPMIDEEATVNPDHVKWLRGFTSKHNSIEPNLVQALHEVTIQRAFCGPFIDIFTDTIKYFRGPRHDRKNNFIRYLFEVSCANSKEARKSLKRYLDLDLPNNKELAPKLKAALASQAHLIRATEPDPSEMAGIFSSFLDEPNLDAIEKHYKEAIKAYPENQTAWQAYEKFIVDQLDNRWLKKAEQEDILKDLADVRLGWVQALPEEIQPRMDLVDYLLEHDRSDEAKEHMDWISGTRREDPLANIMTWKFHIIEAMRLCRRKTWLSKVPASLDEATELWPQWLSKQWLPYLRAAVDLRGGDDAAMDAVEPLDSNSSDAVGACMKLSAAQRMRVPAKDLKPLRATVDDALSNLSKLSTEDLMRQASFFWDLDRTRLTYPAYRKHGPKFLKEFASRLQADPKFVEEHLDSPLLLGALLFMAREGIIFNADFIEAAQQSKQKDLKSHPLFVAVSAAIILYQRFQHPKGYQKHFAESLQKAATQSDSFYRYMFNNLADSLDARSQDYDFGFSTFTSDGECDCESCRAKRGETV